MEEILRTIVENLVEDKEKVEISSKEENGKTTLQVKVASEDMGRIIGRQGKIAHSIRTIIKSLASKEKKLVDVEFLD